MQLLLLGYVEAGKALSERLETTINGVAGGPSTIVKADETPF